MRAEAAERECERLRSSAASSPAPLPSSDKTPITTSGSNVPDKEGAPHHRHREEKLRRDLEDREAKIASLAAQAERLEKEIGGLRERAEAAEENASEARGENEAMQKELERILRARGG